MWGEGGVSSAVLFIKESNFGHDDLEFAALGTTGSGGTNRHTLHPRGGCRRGHRSAISGAGVDERIGRRPCLGRDVPVLDARQRWPPTWASRCVQRTRRRGCRSRAFLRDSSAIRTASVRQPQLRARPRRPPGRRRHATPGSRVHPAVTIVRMRTPVSEMATTTSDSVNPASLRLVGVGLPSAGVVVRVSMRFLPSASGGVPLSQHAAR